MLNHSSSKAIVQNEPQKEQDGKEETLSKEVPLPPESYAIKAKDNTASQGSQDTQGDGLPPASPSKSSSRPPRNPLVLMRQQQQEIGNAALVRQPVAAVDSLWSDNDDEDDQDANQNNNDDDFAAQIKNYNRKTRKKPSRGSRKSTGLDSSRLQTPAYQNDRKPAVHDSSSKMPEFAKPKFGPHNPAEPLVLNDQLQVPLSINRYLAPYQQGE